MFSSLKRLSRTAWCLLVGHDWFPVWGRSLLGQTVMKGQVCLMCSKQILHQPETKFND